MQNSTRSNRGLANPDAQLETFPTSIPAIAGNTTQNTSGSGSSRDYVYSDAEIARRNQQRGRDNNRPNTHTWRFCIDYRKSDDYTKSSDRPIPSMQQ
jgi:hypothetical protein